MCVYDKKAQRYVTLKTIEQNVLVGLRSGKSSAAITDDKRLHLKQQRSTKHRATSLRQHSYLFMTAAHIECS